MTDLVVGSRASEGGEEDEAGEDNSAVLIDNDGFDPLAYFEPEEKEPDSFQQSENTLGEVATGYEGKYKVNTQEKDSGDEWDQTHDAIVRISDLPSLSMKPPGLILRLLLKLFFSADSCNFNDDEEDYDDENKQFFDLINISKEELEEFQK